MKVNILMPTYNGARFIADQLKSIQNQTFTDWHLLIRDDGSTDQTPDIIREFAAVDRRITFINDGKPTKNLGTIASVFELVKSEAADFYFFCDQDDIWLPEKLALTLDEASLHDNSRAVMYYTDLKVVDQELKVVSESMIRSQSHHANTNLLAELTENTVTGGVSMINHALADLWLSADNILMHDWYLALLAASMGELVYIDIPTQLYRQHDSNVLGARTLRKRMKNWIRPWKLVDKYWWLIKSSQEQARKLLELPNLTRENRELIESFVSLTEGGFTTRLSKLQKYKFRKNRTFHTLVFRTLVITNFGNKSEE
ncbi:glycosyltransferase family 2 protein [Streptococcaceae bacterium ESL0729]|nr:glycosyltransferase family 2 protein [Streptococcaceae bacterium ESL0729]